MVPKSASERIALWVGLLITCEQVLLAGLRLDIGPDGELQAAHRKWCEERMRRHDDELIPTTGELNRRMARGG